MEENEPQYPDSPNGLLDNLIDVKRALADVLRSLKAFNHMNGDLLTSARIWACFSIHDQQEFRRLRPADAGPGWMFSLDGVDVYEVPAPGGGTVLAAPPAPERAPGGSAMWFGRHAMGKDGPPVPGVYVGDRDDWMFYGLSRRDARQWASLLHRYAAGEAVPSCAPGEAPCEDFRLPEGE